MIADKLPAHWTGLVKGFLTPQPKVHPHFSLTGSSLLNQVELRLVRIEGDMINRGVFRSASALKRKLMRCISQ